ncbi:GNAT family N-acetyltransferase [Pseudokineococcus sp. 1T1Z-3]|uniref:GNAT family N-acetyltransferase n=1 Tax=Pseudokineococcus sp. 1T1Z-3 TaxID=3132745 RepID=UPI00309E2EED
MQQPVTVRAATREDVDAVVALVESAYRGEASRAGWTTEADLLDGQRTDAVAVAALVEAPGSVVLLLERDGRLLACCHVEARPAAGRAEEERAPAADDRDLPGASRRLAYLGMLAVDPTRQGAGAGRAVLAAGVAHARDVLGATDLEMTVVAQRAELVAWYERRGWARTGQTRPFPYGDERFGRPRRPDLEFVVLTRSTG